MDDNDYVTKKYLKEIVAIFSAEVKRHNDALLEGFRTYLIAMTEQMTTRTQVREINEEENKDTKSKVANHEDRIVSLEEIVL